MFPQVDAFYEKQRSETLQIKNYLQTHCTLGNAFGILLNGMKPQYASARDTAFAALQNIVNTLEKLGDSMAAYGAEVAAEETKNAAEYAALQTQLMPPPTTATQTMPPTKNGGIVGNPNYSARGNAIGSASGEAKAGMLPDNLSEPKNYNPTEVNSGNDIGSIDINVHSGGTATIIIENRDADENGGDREGFTHHMQRPSTPETNNHAGGAEERGAEERGAQERGAEVRGAEELATEARQNAREAAFYDQFWQEQAQNDPLSRSAQELREAWEARQPIDPTATPPGATSLGYSAPESIEKQNAPNIFAVAPTALVSPISTFANQLSGGIR